MSTPTPERSAGAAPSDTDLFRFADEFGPRKIIFVTEPGSGLRAIVVVDNVACGPSIGGVRITPTGNVEECVRLARAMTLKNALAGLPHGGGKSLIIHRVHTSTAEREPLLRAFACAIRDLVEYIPGPDMGTDETCMAWVFDEIGRVVGRPREIGGIALDEIGSTGRGVAAATAIACDRAGLSLDGLRVAVQGFGAVGRNAAAFLAERGARIVAATDSGGGVADPAGIDVAALVEHKRSGRSVADSAAGARLSPGAVLGVECDVLVPAAQPDLIHAGNVDAVRARVVVEGANIPVTHEAEMALHDRGVIVVPDIIANAGGVITAAIEYRGGSEADANAEVEQRIAANTAAVLDAADAGGTPRQAALGLARRRVLAAMATRRHG